MDLKFLTASAPNNGRNFKSTTLAAGHWGAPLFVHEGEVFLDQDRIDDLVWHLEENGLRRR